MTDREYQAEFDRVYVASACDGSRDKMIEYLIREIALLRRDREMLDWWQAHPLKAEVHGGSDDGHVGTFWALGSAGTDLRAALAAIMTVHG